MTQDEIEREKYEARFKAQLDHRSFLLDARRQGLKEGREEGMKQGREEGLQEGRQEGLLVGRIQFCQRLLQEPISETDSLIELSLDQLNQMANELEGRLMTGKSKNGK